MGRNWRFIHAPERFVCKSGDERNKTVDRESENYGYKPIARGFTLVEMMVVVGIMTLLSSILITYDRTSELQVLLYRDQSVVVGVLNRVKALAIQKYYEGGSEEACAFGVHFSPPRTYTIFQDLKPTCNNILDAGEGLETFFLNPRAEFGTITSNDIVFIPPDLVRGSANDTDEVVEIVAGPFKARIIISFAGQITVE